KNTPLEEIYHRGDFQPIERDPYAQRVQLFIEHLSPRIYIHRLSAFASRWEELVAPKWTSDKMGTHQFMIDYLRDRRSFQGKALSKIHLTPEELWIWKDLELRGHPQNSSLLASL
ncbi:MAG: hypothetical protein ACXWC9_00695, partial [Pseudobdellovibrionaceae bacterium]